MLVMHPHLGHYLMATSSRDRLIHVFKAGPEYSFLQTLDDHSASIPSIRFNGQCTSQGVHGVNRVKIIVFVNLQYDVFMYFSFSQLLTAIELWSRQVHHVQDSRNCKHQCCLLHEMSLLYLFQSLKQNRMLGCDQYFYVVHINKYSKDCCIVGWF